MKSSCNHKFGDSVNMQITSINLKEPSYLLWAKGVRVYIGTKGKLKLVGENPSPQDSKMF